MYSAPYSPALKSIEDAIAKLKALLCGEPRHCPYATLPHRGDDGPSSLHAVTASDVLAAPLSTSATAQRPICHDRRSSLRLGTNHINIRTK
jgi:hypothetical protein